MGILILLLLLISTCIVRYIYLFCKNYPNRHYYLFDITYYIEYFDYASCSYCWRFETRRYRFHCKKGTWEEKLTETYLYENPKGEIKLKAFQFWQMVSSYREKRLNKDLHEEKTLTIP
jgi:hypothetical protein